jgi:acetylornithine deacetylase
MDAHGPVAERIAAAVADRRADILALFKELVRIPSETHPPGGDEGPAQRYVAQRLRAMGLAPDVFEPWSVPGVEAHPGWWPGLEYTDRPNVVARWTGTGGGRSLILNGHIDVVPAGDRSLWSHDPYAATQVGGRIYGRGTADQKIGIAAMLMAVQVLMDAGIRPRGDVILESVVNEELGGYNGTLACCAKGYAADAAVVTEASDFHVAAAAKGGQTYILRVPGLAFHHAMWERGVSAIDNAMVMKDALVAWERQRAEETKDDWYFGERARALHPRAVHADTVWYLKAGDPEIMANPTSAELHFWVDHLPGEDREAMLARFEAHLAAAAAAHPWLRDHPPVLERALMRPFTGIAVPPDAPIVASLRRAAAATVGREVDVVGLEGATDAMIFMRYTDIPAVVFCGGSFATAHAPDEWVEADDVVRSAQALALAIVDFCGVA